MTNGMDLSQLGVSDVALIKSVLAEKHTYLPNEKEFKARNNEDIIIRSTTCIGAITSTNLYTVPENMTLFITGAWVTAKASSGNANTTGVRFSSTLSFTRCMVGAMATGAGGLYSHQSNAVSFPMPIKAESGQSIEIVKSGSSGAQSFGGFVGWLEKKAVVPTVEPPQQ